MLGLTPTEEECAAILGAYERLRSANSELYAMFDAEPRTLKPEHEAFLPFKRDHKHFPQTQLIVENLVDLGVVDASGASDQLILEAGSGTGELGLATALRLTSLDHSRYYERQLAELNERAADGAKREKKNVIPIMEPSWKKFLFMCDLMKGLKGKQDRYFCFSDFCCFRIAGDLLELSPQLLCRLARRYSPIKNVAITAEQAKQEGNDISGQEAEQKKVVVIGKHLCGAATDIVLRYDAHAFGIALCCHYKSDGSLYCNPEYLSDLTSRFSISRLHKLTSYQHCFGDKAELTEKQRALKALGYKVRQILDVGRLLYLRTRGYECGLVRYCDESLTGEQWLLWARRDTC